MNGKRILALLATLALAALASACIQKNTGDEPNASTVPQGLNRFLLFPNPVAMSAGGFETNTSDYADAYYRAIDPGNKRTTLADWMAENGFTASRTPKAGSEHLAVFHDTRDLGYGRRMTGRRNSADGSIAFFVENYSVVPNSSADYSNVLNVEAAILRDTRWHVGTNAIEWSVGECTTAEATNEGCDGTVMFAKFYNFSSKDGTRQLAVDLDGNGLKTMPGPCITCHGGRGDPLTPGEGNPSKPRFPLVENSRSRKRGDVQAHLHGMNVGSFEFSARPGFTRTAQEASLRDFNQWILCSYPVPGGAAVSGVCTLPAAGNNEWQGTAAEIIQSWYGASTPLLAGSFSDNPPHVPAGWSGNPALYTDVVAPYCRTCHILRGTVNQDEIDFNSLAKFLSYADRIKAHVFDRGTMPLAKIVYNDFWNSDAPRLLANAINPSLTPPQTATDSTGAALRPGRPIANPGPDRMVRTGADATLSAENSLFASSFSWSQVPGNPPGATITNANSMIATFHSTAAGAFKVRLSVNGGADSKDVTIRVDDAFPIPANLKFAHVKNVLQNLSHTTSQTTGICTDCHKVPTVAPAPLNTPPVWYTNFDRNGSGGAADTTDDAWFAKAVQGRVNLTEIEASPLLRKPSGHHHNGKMLLDVSDTVNGGLRDYSIIYNWILAGMPAGGIAASPIVNGGTNPIVTTFTGPFGGPFTSASPIIVLDGSGSIAPSGVVLTYAWSIVSQPPNSNPVLSSTIGAAPTLTVQNVGDYVAQLQVSGGGTTDTAQQKFTVTETPFTANFDPVDGGSGAVNFSGTRGDLVLTNTSTGVAGNPVSCTWTVLSGPGVVAPGVGAAGGPLLNGSSTLVSVPQPCITVVTITLPPPFGQITFNLPATANLNVASSTLNQNYVVQLTASTVTSKSVTHTVKVAENPPVPSISVGATSVAFGGNPPFASISLSGSSTGIAPLSFAWSIDNEPIGATVGSTIGTSGSPTATLFARATGSYTVRLTVTDSTGASGATTSTFTVTPSRGTTFATMTTLLSNGVGGIGCTNCHGQGNGNPVINSGSPPSWANVTEAGTTLWQRVSARAFNGSSTLTNTLLLNPRNVTNVTFNPNGHGGLCQPGFGCDATGSANLTSFSNWTQDGSPPGN